MKIIACQVCERIFKTINEVKKHVADKSIIVRDGKETAVTTVMLVLED